MSDNLARVLRPSWQAAGASAAEREYDHDRDHAAPQETPRRHIEIVATRSQRQARPRIIYALSAVTAMAAIVVSQLLLSVGISQSAYEISTLQSRQVELGRTAESLSEDLVRASSPQSLAANAAALGMVSNSNPVYLRLSDGVVLGAPQQAKGTPAGGTTLVPNSLLAGAPLVTQLPPPGAQGTGVPTGTSGAASVASPVKPADVQVKDGLPTPATR
jgi:hypothetical protein